MCSPADPVCVVVALDAFEELVVDGGEAGVITLAGVVALA
jgi:hypothetical protein